MRQPTYGSQSKFRFNLRTDHKIRDIARFYHELPQTLMWVDHKSSGDNKVLHTTASSRHGDSLHRVCLAIGYNT